MVRMLAVLFFSKSRVSHSSQLLVRFAVHVIYRCKMDPAVFRASALFLYVL